MCTPLRCSSRPINNLCDTLHQSCAARSLISHTQMTTVPCETSCTSIAATSPPWYIKWYLLHSSTLCIRLMQYPLMNSNRSHLLLRLLMLSLPQMLNPTRLLSRYLKQLLRGVRDQSTLTSNPSLPLTPHLSVHDLWLTFEKMICGLSCSRTKRTM